MIFRHKPFEIDAIQSDGTPEANRMIIKRTKHSKTPAYMARTLPEAPGEDLTVSGVLTLRTPEGDQPVHKGDYIGEGADGSYCAFPKKCFEATYEPLIPVAQAMPFDRLNGKRLN